MPPRRSATSAGENFESVRTAVLQESPREGSRADTLWLGPTPSHETAGLRGDTASRCDIRKVRSRILGFSRTATGLVHKRKLQVRNWKAQGDAPSPEYLL